MNDFISIILINYNGANDTIQCIKSLEKITHKNYRIIIVDNCSTDYSVKLIIEQLNDKCILIESKINGGFSSGNNIGIKEAMRLGTDYILLLNNDTEVEPNFINEMLKVHKNRENVGIVSCKMMYYDNKDYIWFGGGYFDINTFNVGHESYKCIDSCENDIREITFSTGCCMLIGVDVINKVGLLDEKYFMYFEDADYCIRVSDNNYKIIYNPNAVIYHKVSAASGGEESAFYLEWTTRNRLIFMNKFKAKINKYKYVKLKIKVYIKAVAKVVLYILKGDLKKSKSILVGLKRGRSYTKNNI